MPLEKLVPKQIVTMGVSAVRSLVVCSLGSILVCPARRPGVGAGSLWTPRVCELGTEAATTGSSFIVMYAQEVTVHGKLMVVTTSNSGSSLLSLGGMVLLTF